MPHITEPATDKLTVPPNLAVARTYVTVNQPLWQALDQKRTRNIEDCSRRYD